MFTSVLIAISFCACDVTMRVFYSYYVVSGFTVERFWCNIRQENVTIVKLQVAVNRDRLNIAPLIYNLTADKHRDAHLIDMFYPVP